MGLVGVTVLPEYIQSEGVEPLLDNLIQRAGVTAVATSPYVMDVADEETGSREPPIDAGAGAVRLLDRPLWGKRELWVKTAPSFTPDKALYDGLLYQPAEPTELTTQHGHIIQEFIDAAHARDIQVYFQVMAAIPPGYRVQFGGPEEDDMPRLHDGRLATKRVDKNGSLASPQILAYQRALIRDLCKQYPSIDAIRFDWPEYPPYLLDCMFFDFCDHARQAAGRLGFDFAVMQNDASRLYEKLHGGLTNDDLEPAAVDQILAQYPGVIEALKLKATLSEEYLSALRETLNDASGGETRMAPSAFPPPWSYVSGMDFARNAKHCDEISVKLYGMHWAMMLRFYGDQIMQANPSLSSQKLVRALVRLLGIADDDGFSELEDYQYPSPEEPHPAGARAQIQKIQTAQQAAGDTPIHVLAHGYGPLEDFQRRIKIAHQASPHGFWVNRYGYLTDEKLDAIGVAGA